MTGLLLLVHYFTIYYHISVLVFLPAAPLNRSLTDLLSPSFRLVDLLYDFLSANRLSLGGALDGIIAAKRMDMSKSGKETCSGEDYICMKEEFENRGA